MSSFTFKMSLIPINVNTNRIRKVLELIFTEESAEEESEEESERDQPGTKRKRLEKTGIYLM